MTKAERVRRTRAVYARMFLDNEGRPTLDGLEVLLELRKFCCADKRWSADVNTTYHRLGMRDVYDHIVQILELDPLAKASEHQKEIDAHDRPATAATE